MDNKSGFVCSKMAMIRICNAKSEQINEIILIYDYAKGFMKKNGNPNQWDKGYPSKELIMQDITNGNLYVGMDERDTIHFVFAFIIGREPSYDLIEQGEWLNNDTYGTIHRIASNGKTKGVFDFCMRFCKSKISNIRIDTHKDNKIMQHLIEKSGFQTCGIIHLQDNSERIAYQNQT